MFTLDYCIANPSSPSMSMLPAIAALLLAEREVEVVHLERNQLPLPMKRKTRGQTREWVKRRKSQGDYTNLRQELLFEDQLTYK